MFGKPLVSQLVLDPLASPRRVSFARQAGPVSIVSSSHFFLSCLLCTSRYVSRLSMSLWWTLLPSHHYFRGATRPAHYDATTELLVEFVPKSTNEEFGIKKACDNYSLLNFTANGFPIIKNWNKARSRSFVESATA